VNQWHAAYVNNHINNPINLHVVQHNIQNLAAQVAELQNQINLLQQMITLTHLRWIICETDIVNLQMIDYLPVNRWWYEIGWCFGSVL
jgi:hypothetical protein